MKYIVILLMLCLSACTSVPVVPKFPDSPGKNTLERCPKLQQLKDNPTLSDVSKTIAENYGTYYECAVKADMWIEWYQIQKKIYEDIK
jgi:hypothetical protein